MEIRTLRYFLAVAREENMTRAAEQLHVTQPTLSKTLKVLEDELGKKLFTRHSFSIVLTEEGMMLSSMGCCLTLSCTIKLAPVSWNIFLTSSPEQSEGSNTVMPPPPLVPEVIFTKS